MSKVTRYNFGMESWRCQDPQGDFVKYSDYELLEQAYADLEKKYEILDRSYSVLESMFELDGIVVEVNESQYNTLAPYLDKTSVASVDPLTDSSSLLYGFPNVSGTIVLYLNENDWEWDRPEDFREESPEYKAKYHEVSYEEILDYLIKHYS